MSRPSSSSTIPQQKGQLKVHAVLNNYFFSVIAEVSPNMVFRRTSSGHVGGSSVVYRKNSPGYSNSRDCQCIPLYIDSTAYTMEGGAYYRIILFIEKYD